MNLVKQTLNGLVVGGTLLSLAACTLLSNDGYHGGDHRGGGPTGPLTASASANKVDPAKVGNKASQEDDAVYTGGDHRGGGPTGPLSQ